MKRIVFALLVCLTTSPVLAVEGMLNVPSAFGVKESADRLERGVASKGMTVFARINHAQAAQQVGTALRPTELIIFGNPKVGSVLMQCQQSVALDLPQKALIWQGPEGQVWISYNDPDYLEKRHQISGCESTLAKVAQALATIVQTAASDSP